MSLEARYKEIKLKIESISNGRSVTLIAVSKKQPIESIEKLYELGHRDFGENYVQELVEKSDYFLKKEIRDIRWHFIGHLQTNKVKILLPLVHTIHSIDTLKVAKEIETRSQQMGLNPVPCFIEVNIDNESTKSGVLLKDAPEMAQAISKMPHLSLQGLMCIPSPENSDHENAFQTLSELQKQFSTLTQKKLSMGMSEDFEVAIQQGSTHVRIGTALFGPRM